MKCPCRNHGENKDPYQDDKHLIQRTENMDNKGSWENKEVPSVKRGTTIETYPLFAI